MTEQDAEVRSDGSFGHHSCSDAGTVYKNSPSALTSKLSYGPIDIGSDFRRRIGRVAVFIFLRKLLRHEAVSGLTHPVEDDARTQADEGHDPSVLRFSLSGVQLKFSASGDPDRGLTIPVRGIGGHWVVKLPDQRYDRVPGNEFSMMAFAKAVGIDVPRVGPVSRNDIGGVPVDVRFEGNAYYIERFDRTTDGGRIHAEDFAQANQLYPSEQYRRFNFNQLLMQVADAIGSEAAMTLIERIVFNVGIGNGDMHAKNWSVIYRDGRTPSLAPAYDYVSTLLYVEAENVGMNLAGTKPFLDIDMVRFMRLAANARVSTKMAEMRARRMVERMRDVWPTIKDALPLANDLRETVTERARTSIVNSQRRAANAAGVRGRRQICVRTAVTLEADFEPDPGSGKALLLPILTASREK